jgi:tRNA (guanosine-2'-O-)-methyltransferase
MDARCPHLGPRMIAGESFTHAEQIEILTPYLTEARCKRIARVVPTRTYAVTPVMENLYDRGNTSAVLRSAEALGFQSAHIVAPGKKFKKANRVTQGAEKWLDVAEWESTAECVAALRAQGYRVLATRMKGATHVEETDFSQPSAIFLGNEQDGLSEELLETADDAVFVPMDGFSQSLNISVAAAICLYQARRDRKERIGTNGDLTAAERLALTAEFYFRSVEHAERLLLKARGVDSPAGA